MGHTFHDLNIQSSLSSGNSSIDAIAGRADTLEIDRIAVCDYLTDHDDLNELKDAIGAVEADVDIFPGVKIRADDERELKDKLSAFRDQIDVVIVHGGDDGINRAACEDSRVDILAHPEFKRRDSGLDHVIAKAASQNSVAIELTFSSILKTYGKLRAQIMNHMQRNIKLARKYDAPLILGSGARSVHQMRRPRDMVGFANCMGIELSAAFQLVEKTPSQILKRAEDARSDDQVRPGVTIEDFGDDDGT